MKSEISSRKQSLSRFATAPFTQGSLGAFIVFEVYRFRFPLAKTTHRHTARPHQSLPLEGKVAPKVTDEVAFLRWLIVFAASRSELFGEFLCFALFLLTNPRSCGTMKKIRCEVRV